MTFVGRSVIASLLCVACFVPAGVLAFKNNSIEEPVWSKRQTATLVRAPEEPISVKIDPITVLEEINIVGNIPRKARKRVRRLVCYHEEKLTQGHGTVKICEYR